MTKLKSVSDLGALLHKLETKSFFDLDRKTRNQVWSLGGKYGALPIEAWSFVPHPLTLQKIKSVQRYIVTIDTVSSEVYSPVHAFLEDQKANVAAYYSGGWADFVCDVRLTENEFDDWKAALRKILIDANAQRFVQDQNVDRLVSIFEVISSPVLCGRVIDGSITPTDSILTEISTRPQRFELAFRNYRSSETLSEFGNDETAVHRYLRRLKKEHAILCFRVVTDAPRYYARDYVALRIGQRVAHNLVRALKDKKELRKPVDELLEVRNIQYVDESEKSITYMFVNSYDFPGERIDWKQKVYNTADVRDVNLYNYPLEGTLNECPIYLSDYPEFLKRAKAYETSAGIPIGTGYYPTTSATPPPIRLPADCLAFGGVTFGLSNSGKTNADLVLATEFIKFVTNVIVIDGTEGVWNKLEGLNLPKDTTSKMVLDVANPISQTLATAATKRGLVVIEFGKPALKRAVSLGDVMDAAIEFIRSRPDSTKGNAPRAIKNVLMIEEAADAWLDDPDRSLTRGNNLCRLLEETMRKGWCIWLSTQHPEELGPNPAVTRTLLSALKNRVVFGVDRQTSKELLFDVFREEGHSADDLKYIGDQIDNRAKGRALVRSVSSEAKVLPPVFVNFPLLKGR